MSKPQRFQRKRGKGARLPEGTIYVGRPTVRGNPWIVENEGRGGWKVYGPGVPSGGSRCGNEEGARLVAVNLFREWASTEHARRKLQLQEIRGKNLACYCRAHDPCHADVLIELANEDDR